MRGGRAARSRQISYDAAPTSYGAAIRPHFTMASSIDGRAKFKGMELLATITSTAGGTVADRVAFSPCGLPRVGSMVENYGVYRILKLRVHYAPLIGTTASGAVVMVSTADSSVSPSPPDYATVASMCPTRTSVWAPAVYTVDTSVYRQAWYSTDDNSAPIARNAEEMANIIMWAAVGVPASTSIGEIWIEYEVEAATPMVAGANNP